MNDIRSHRFIFKHYLDSIQPVFRSAQLELDRFSYNLFTLSSYNSYLENFHSDIIALFLDPTGPHGEKSKFLNLFLAYLANHHNLTIELEDFQDAEVFRESGKIDIWIKGKKSILIESKINEADDQPNQLDRYFSFVHKNSHDVVGLLYLVPLGIKSPPMPANPVAQKVLRKLVAKKRTGRIPDLIDGWLFPCYKSTESEDNRSLLWQYIKLLQYHCSSVLKSNAMKQFYELINSKDSLEAFNEMLELKKRVPVFRADKFVTEIGEDYQPFQKYYKYADHHRLYENCEDGENSWKVDVYFSHDGSVSVTFWNPPFQKDEHRYRVIAKLNEMGMLEDFPDEGPYWGRVKTFELGEEIPTLNQMDKLVAGLVRKLMGKLGESVKSS